MTEPRFFVNEARSPALVERVTWLSFFLWVLSSATAFSQPYYLGPGTQKMAQRLEDIARKADPMKNRFLNAQRAELFRHLASKATNIEQKAILYGELPVELLNAGRPQEAIAEFGTLEEMLKQYGLFEMNKLVLRNLQAVAYLRLGEH